jgi:hypothetical protein
MTLAGLEIWRQFFRRANLEIEADWIYGGGTLKGIRFIVFNTGHRKTVITRAGIRCSDDTNPRSLRTDQSILDQLPVVLDVDGVSPKLFVQAAGYLTDGRAKGVLVEDHKRNQKLFPLPPFPSKDDPMFKRDGS